MRQSGTRVLKRPILNAPKCFRADAGGRSRLSEKFIWFVLLVLFRFLDSACTGGVAFFLQ